MSRNLLTGARMRPMTIARRLKGRHASNWPGLILIDPDCPFPAAVWAQKAWEAQAKLNPLTLLRTRLSRTARRAFEIMGHEIEVQAAALIYGADPETYRARESRSMKRGDDGLFADMSLKDIRTAMTARSTEAAKWVGKNHRRIRQHRRPNRQT